MRNTKRRVFGYSMAMYFLTLEGGVGLSHCIIRYELCILWRIKAVATRQSSRWPLPPSILATMRTIFTPWLRRCHLVRIISELISAAICIGRTWLRTRCSGLRLWRLLYNHTKCVWRRRTWLNPDCPIITPRAYSPVSRLIMFTYMRVDVQRSVYLP